MWTVHLGKLLLNLSGPSEEVVRIRAIHLHRYFARETNDYDLALLRLEPRAPSSPQPPQPPLHPSAARPVCLPPPTHLLEPGRTCWVSGWGALEEDGE